MIHLTCLKNALNIAAVLNNQTLEIFNFDIFKPTGICY